MRWEPPWHHSHEPLLAGPFHAQRLRYSAVMRITARPCDPCCDPAIHSIWPLLPVAAGTRPILPGLIQENPSLLVRMDYYMAALSLDDLPIEIQNVRSRSS